MSNKLEESPKARKLRIKAELQRLENEQEINTQAMEEELKNQDD